MSSMQRELSTPVKNVSIDNFDQTVNVKSDGTITNTQQVPNQAVEGFNKIHPAFLYLLLTALVALLLFIFKPQGVMSCKGISRDCYLNPLPFIIWSLIGGFILWVIIKIIMWIVGLFTKKSKSV